MKEVRPVIKYLLFGFNMFFWLIGFAIFGVGVYALVEKDTFTHISELSLGVVFNPAFILLIAGGLVFLLGFFGCIGALRENTLLLSIFNYTLIFILLVQIVIAVLIYFYKDKAVNEIGKQLKEMIKSYRDDDDLQDLIDWMQRDWLGCCGMSDYRDWDLNVYFQCRDDPWVESCGVPASCCLPDYSKNFQCGYGARVQNSQSNNGTMKIYTDGCLKKAEEWFKYNLVPIAIVLGSIALLQISGIVISQCVINDVQRVKRSFK